MTNETPQIPPEIDTKILEYQGQSITISEAKEILETWGIFDSKFFEPHVSAAAYVKFVKTVNIFIPIDEDPPSVLQNIQEGQAHSETHQGLRQPIRNSIFRNPIHRVSIILSEVTLIANSIIPAPVALKPYPGYVAPAEMEDDGAYKSVDGIETLAEEEDHVDDAMINGDEGKEWRVENEPAIWVSLSEMGILSEGHLRDGPALVVGAVGDLFERRVVELCCVGGC
ncbi:uncharacterized protein KY384_001315 [Bacidia gigantensis]|uniref:uncharacterized protein n=1 Tax=Bacidia gigantensis TaxID=2732470 RepID=UPI001D0375B3|nr:uncharacterized protein KY384_001315 [Bacidia gigantensis]KAG8533575.1 hypothetical protein KY384_001315 [Bacidia gigantensis]